MHNTGRDTGGSQFFLNFKYNKILDGRNTVFGRIVSEVDVLDKIDRTELIINGFEQKIEQAKPDKIISAEVIRKRDHSYRVRKKGEPELTEEEESKEDKEGKDKEEKMAEKAPAAEDDKAEENKDVEAESKEADGKEKDEDNKSASKDDDEDKS